MWGDGKLPIKGIIIVTHNIEEAVLMCDRILLFSSNPGRIIREIAVDLKQPRNRLDPRFRDLVEKVYVAMTARTQRRRASVTRPEWWRQRSTRSCRACPPTFCPALGSAGRAPYNGKADLPVFADELHLEGDDLFPVADALQMMHFVEIEGGDIKLTDVGKQYVEADTDERKRIFQRQLLSEVPLAAHIRRVLQERGNHGAPKSRFFDELEDHMSTEDAEETLRSVTAWARYGEAFAYDDDTQTFSLENPT